MSQLIKLIKSMVSELLIILFTFLILKPILKPKHIIMLIIRLVKLLVLFIHLNQSIDVILT